MAAKLKEESRRLRRQHFAHVSIAGLATATYDPPQFLVEGLIPEGHVTLLGGHGGVGKSMLALILAAHCASGWIWAGLQTKQTRSVFVSLEDSGDLVRHRLKRVVDCYGLDPEQIEAELVILDGTQGDAALAVEVNDMGARRIEPTANMVELRELVTGAGLIVIDNASDAFDGDENNRRQVRAFIRMLAQVAQEEGAAVLLLAHIDKNAAKNGSQGNSYSGSTAWHNSARSRLALVPSKCGVELRHEKLNIGRKVATIELDWSEDSGVLIPSQTVPETGRDARLSAEAAEDDAKVLEAIVAAI